MAESNRFVAECFVSRLLGTTNEKFSDREYVTHEIAMLLDRKEREKDEAYAKTKHPMISVCTWCGETAMEPVPVQHTPLCPLSARTIITMPSDKLVAVKRDLLERFLELLKAITNTFTTDELNTFIELEVLLYPERVKVCVDNPRTLYTCVRCYASSTKSESEIIHATNCAVKPRK